MVIKRVVCLMLAGGMVFTVPVAAGVSLDSALVKYSDMQSQLDELFVRISTITGVKEQYVRELYELAGGSLIYADRYPDVYLDTTVQSAKPPMELTGATTVYRECPLPECDGVSRIMAYYVPDAIYSVVTDVSKLMDERIHYDRGGFQVYYNSFVPEIKSRIAFYEAVLLYTGTPVETVDKLQTLYERILAKKSSDENVVEVTPGGVLQMKQKYITSLHGIGFSDEVSIDYLTRLFASDYYLAKNSDIEDIRSVYILPYEPNVPQRLNMMTAAACLVGRVRYVWGGGHSGASYIDGINPMWAKFNALYPTNSEADGFGTCIKPSGSWCPIHGYTGAEYHGGSVRSLDEYVGARAEEFNASELLSTKYRKMLEQVDYSVPINIHTLDGLDCSGFCSWLVNQVTDQFNINSTAAVFTSQYGMQKLTLGEDLLPGDIYAWSTHVVAIVGKVAPGSKAYVSVEATPNILKYGVVYYDGATDADLTLARQIAREANQLIGGIYEEPHVYCMSTVGSFVIPEESIDIFVPDGVQDMESEVQPPEEYIRVEQEPIDGGVVMHYILTEASSGTTGGVGRPNVAFTDAGFESLTAQEVIQKVLTKLTVSYVAGYDNYNGSLFDKSLVASNLGGWTDAED